MPDLTAPTIEASVIGAILKYPTARREARTALRSSDFSNQVLAKIYDIFLELDAENVPLDPDLITYKANHKNITPETLSDLITQSEIGPVGPKIDILANLSQRRQMAAACTKAIDMLPDTTMPTEEIFGIVADAYRLQASMGTNDDVYSIYDYLNSEIEDERWIIPDLLSEGERVTFVAPYATGKSTLLRQISLCAAAGVHPFDPMRQIPQRRTLIIDLENPPQILRKMIAQVAATIRGLGTDSTWMQQWCHIWTKSGINPLSRVDVSALLGTIEKFRPELIAIGPIYKMTPRGESSTEYGAEITSALLDEVRTRYKSALLIEAHPPHPSEGVRWVAGKNQGLMRQSGASLWGRWPDFIINLYPDPATGGLEVQVAKARDINREWPRHLDRGDSLHFEPSRSFDEN